MLLGDDGVGPYVVHVLEKSFRFDDCVTLVDLGTPGLDLVAHLSGVDALILIDSVENGSAPGTVTLYRREEILRHGPAPVRMDPHAPALSESLLIAEIAGESPQEVLLIGITGEHYETSTFLSGSVRDAVGRAVLDVLLELDRLGVGYQTIDTACDCVAWWETAEHGSATTGTAAHTS